MRACSVAGSGFDLTSPALMSRAANHAVGTHGRLVTKTGNRASIAEGRIRGGYNLCCISQLYAATIQLCVGCTLLHSL